ncbi:diacylglycerol/lipid kinase family protein [Elioraea rosea]|uniref:diacylglycerol/lipid kinase family protein n=1 Tax=Elioraea rosea TaxID=2492390 RepID=UPI001183FED6|nr:diacylglycerol kinase family protein [Elioraea rosea]
MLLIFNPAAGRRRRRRFERVAGALAEAGVRFTVADTARSGDAERLAREAAGAGERVVVAAGGDGTIAEVANGIAGTDAALGVIPTGTANVFAHELGLPFRAEAIATMLRAGVTRRVIPGRALFGCGRERLFLQMLGVGFDAAVVAALDAALKRRIGKGAYVVETLRQLASWPFPRLSVTIGGATIEAAQVIATKGRFYGGRFLLAPGAMPDAAGITACVFERGGLGAAAIAGLALPLGLVSRLGGFSARRVATLGIDAPPGLPVQADGDLVGVTPVALSDAPAPLPVIVPTP